MAKSQTAGTIRLPPSLNRKNLKASTNADAATSAATTGPTARKGQKCLGTETSSKLATLTPKPKKSKQNDNAAKGFNDNHLLEVTNANPNLDSNGIAANDIDKEIARLLALKTHAHQLVAMKNNTHNMVAQGTAQQVTSTTANQNVPTSVLPTLRRMPAPKPPAAHSDVLTPSRSATVTNTQDIEKVPKPEGVPGLKVENGGFNIQSAARADSSKEWNHFINIVHGAAERADKF
ncbi:hypothetical protein PQX77_016890 [Marasmius sp. AFHP31]|nr:hypothetical protein PQX77_016890 [Marasmius sp. AFHP31]